MSVIISGVTMPDCKVTPSDDGALHAANTTDGILNGCAITYSGLNVYIAAGRALVNGREVKVDSATTVALANTNTYARVKLVIDKSQNVGDEVFFDVDYAASTSGLATLTKDDLNDGGTKHEVTFAIFKLSGGAIASKEFELREARARAVAKQYTIPTSAWSSLTAEVVDVNTVAGQHVVCTPDPSTRDEWLENGVYLYSLSYGKLTFKCKSKPSSSVKANVLYI